MLVLFRSLVFTVGLLLVLLTDTAMAAAQASAPAVAKSTSSSSNMVLGSYRDPQSEFDVVWLLDMAAQKISFTVTRTVQSSSSADFFAVAAPKWFAIALARQHVGMTSQTDMLFIRNAGTDGRTCEVTDRFANRASEPYTDEYLGGSNDLTVVSADVVYDATQRRLKASCVVTRPLVTTDLEYDTPIRNETIRLGFAYGAIADDGSFLKHVKGTIRTMDVNFYKPFSMGEDAVEANRWSSVLYWHAVCMIVSWFLLMIPAVWLARYFKRFVPAWFKYHWVVQLVACLLAITGIIVAFTGELDACLDALE